MSEKKSRREKQTLEIPREILKKLVSHINLKEMDYDHAEAALEQVKAQLGELAMAEVVHELGEEDRRPKACPKCGRKVPVKSAAMPREILGLSGTQTIRRNYHYCPDCKEGFYPRDIELGLSKQTPYSPQLEKRILDFGINDPYGECAERFALHYEHRVSSNGFRQVVKRMGGDVESSAEDLLQIELSPPKRAAAKTLYVMNDGSMLPTIEGWKESKVGLVFREADLIPSTPSNRGWLQEARYCAVLGGQDEFFHSLSELLEVEQAGRAKRVVWLADGAVGNWKLASACAPYAIQILDFWHAVEHGADAAKILFQDESGLIALWTHRIRQLLLLGDFQALIDELMDCTPEASDDELEALNNLVRYYRNNDSRMNYRHYLDLGLCIGSGAIESAHRHVLQKRMKLAGQHWSIDAGRRMARLRAAYRTAGPGELYSAIHRAKKATLQRGRSRRSLLRLVA